jgi:hypothetical protein
MELILLSIIGATFMLTTEFFELVHIHGIASGTALSDNAADFAERCADTLTVPVTVRM